MPSTTWESFIWARDNTTRRLRRLSRPCSWIRSSNVQPNAQSRPATTSWRRAEIVIVTEQQTFRMPKAPQSIDGAGVGMDLILQLVTKTLHFAGELSGTALGERLGVVFNIIEPCLDLLKRERHCEIVGGAVLG